MAWYDGIVKAYSPQTYDRAQARIDLKKFEADPTYRINPSEYADPATGIAYDAHLKGLRDFKLSEQANPLLDKFHADYANLAGPDKRFYADPESRTVLMAEGLQVPEAAGNPYIRKGLQDFARQGQLESDLADQFAAPGDNNVLARLAANPQAQAQNSIISTLQSGIGSAATREAAAAKVAEEKAGKVNLADFQRVVSGMTGQAQSPGEQQRLAKTGGYDPNGEVDILQAASAYGIPAETADKAIDNYRQLMEKTPTGNPTPYKMGTGRSTEEGLLQNFVLGAPKNIANTTSTAPVNITLKGGVAQSAFVDPVTGKPLVFDKATGSYRVANVEGGATPKPAAFTPESAAKTQMVEQALTYMPLIRAGLILPDGTVDRTNVANMNVRTPFTEGRAISTYVMDAVEAKLRAESGAAVPEPEVKRAAKRFIPAVADNDDQVKIKLNNLETYLKGTADKINQGRAKDARPVAPAGTKARVNGKIVTSDGKGGWN